MSMYQPSDNPASAEPGWTTTEFAGINVASLLTLVVGLASSHGLSLTPDAQATVNEAMVAIIAALQAIYAVSRGIRKRGTPA